MRSFRVWAPDVVNTEITGGKLDSAGGMHVSV